VAAVPVAEIAPEEDREDRAGGLRGEIGGGAHARAALEAAGAGTLGDQITVFAERREPVRRPELRVADQRREVPPAAPDERLPAEVAELVADEPAPLGVELPVAERV